MITTKLSHLEIVHPLSRLQNKLITKIIVQKLTITLESALFLIFTQGYWYNYLFYWHNRHPYLCAAT